MSKITDNLKVLKEVLIKSGNGQWSLNKIDVPTEIATLKKTADPDNWHYHTSENPNKHLHEKHQGHIDDIVTLLGKSAKEGNENKVNRHLGMLRKHVLSAPKGSIDLGHLHDIMEEKGAHSYKVKGTNFKFKHAFTDEHMSEFINHHAGDAKSLKDIHDNHGGMGAVKAILKQHGSGGAAREYNQLNFKQNPHIFNEALNLMNPKKGEWSEGPEVKNDEAYESIYHDHINEDHHKNVVDTWINMQDHLTNTEYPNPQSHPDEEAYQQAKQDHYKKESDLTSAHDNAVWDRALNTFKTAHGIK